jgi:hypothetical protein
MDPTIVSPQLVTDVPAPIETSVDVDTDVLAPIETGVDVDTDVPLPIGTDVDVEDELEGGGALHAKNADALVTGNVAATMRRKVTASDRERAMSVSSGTRRRKAHAHANAHLRARNETAMCHPEPLRLRPSGLASGVPLGSRGCGSIVGRAARSSLLRADPPRRNGAAAAIAPRCP